MKLRIYLNNILLMLAIANCNNIKSERISVPSIGSKAPAFKAETNLGNIDFPAEYTGKWVILFSHPADFTPVCTTEFKKLAKMVPEFEKLNAQLIGLSVDSKYIHGAWVKKLEKDMQAKGEEREINFPIVADLDKKISKAYGMIHPNESKEQTVRSVLIIDPNGKVRVIFYYPISTGRSFNEIKRILQALQITDKLGVATPAEWKPGMPTITKKNKKMAGFA